MLDKIIAMLEKADPDAWSPPWGSSIPTNFTTNRAYRGNNVLNLWSAQFTDHRWATYNQWEATGFQVAKGQKSTPIWVFKPPTPGDPDSKGVSRAARVFNVEQLTEPPPPVHKAPATLAQVETFVNNVAPQVNRDPTRAFFHPGKDFIAMPALSLFHSTEGYYATLLHELVHWTGHTSRLDRPLQNKFGSNAYAFEELIAEIGSAFLCAELNITPTIRVDHVHYLKNWLEVLKGDAKSLQEAATLAQKAVDHLMVYQTRIEIEEAA